MIGYDRLKVKSPYTIQHIQQLSMTWKPGEHGHLSLQALLQDTTTDHAAVEAAWQETITLYEDDGQQKATLFKGLITSVKITHTQGVYMLELEAKSSSVKLDIQKKRRSFQNTSQTYAALMSEVSSAYDGADVSCLIGDDVSISSPIIQYEETDWELMKRLASEFHSFVVCDILEATPKLYFGIPQGKERNPEQEVSYRASKDLIAYQQAGGAEAGLHDTDFFSYDISSKEVYAIGDRVQFRNKQMIVKEVSAQMVQGELQYEYRLVREDGLRQGTIHNAKLAGISLEGEILAVQGEQVKLKLDIDNKQPSSTAYWYPFAPATGSMMYCMPQIGTKARLYLPEASGKGAIVIGSVRKNGDSSEKTGDPSTRYFGNEHGSELKLAPKVVAFAGASEDPLTFTLDDDFGISMISPTRLSLDATLDLTLYTPKRVVLKTTSQIIAKKKNADIGMSVESEYHLLGTAVGLKGKDRTSYPPYDDAPTVTEPDPKPPFNWKKLALNVLGGLAVVAAVAAAAAFTAVTLGAGAVVVGAIVAGAAFAGTAAVAGVAISDIARGEVSSFKEYGVAALRESFVGAVTGAIFGPFGTVGTIGTKMVIGGVSNATESIASQLLTDGKINFKSVLIDAGLGFATVGVIDSKVGKRVGGYIGNKITNSAVSKAFQQLGNKIGDASKWLKNGVKTIATKTGNAYKAADKYTLKLTDDLIAQTKKLNENLKNVMQGNQFAFAGYGGTKIDLDVRAFSGGGGRVEIPKDPLDEIRKRVKENVEKSKAAREASNFDEYLKREKELLNRLKLIEESKDFVREQLEKHVEFLKNGGIKKPLDSNGFGGGNYKPGVITAAVDITTIRNSAPNIKFGYNGRRDGQFNPSVTELHKDLEVIINKVKEQAKNDPLNKFRHKDSFEDWHIENCAEIQAVNQLLHSGAKIENILISTVSGQGKYKAPCSNCQRTFLDFIMDLQ